MFRFSDEMSTGKEDKIIQAC